MKQMDKIRFGVVGTNFITDWLIEGARYDVRFSLTAVCSRQEETGKAFALKHSVPHVYTAVEEMVSSPDVDAVYIASPNALHASQAIICMEHGKHVLCEKPLASNSREAERMIDVARRNGVVLMEAMKPTLSPNFRVLTDNLYRIGKVRRFFASYCQYSSRYDALKRGVVANAFRPELSNGAVMDIGVYCLYPMVVLFGKPEAVIASAMKLPTGVDGQGSVVCRYDGFDAVAVYSKISDSHLPSEIQGEDGTLSIDRINQPRKIMFYPRDKTKPAEDLSVRCLENEYYYEVKEFLDLIESGSVESKVNSHKNSLDTIAVIDEVRFQSGIVFPADGEM